MSTIIWIMHSSSVIDACVVHASQAMLGISIAHGGLQTAYSALS
jgi:hypothetical protein